MEKAKLILVSRQVTLREALAVLLSSLPGWQVTCHTSSYRECVELASRQRPDLVLADAELPDEDLKVIADYCTVQAPTTGLLLYSNLATKERLLQLMTLNAQGYLTTDLTSQAFARLLEEALQGSTAISPTILTEVLEQYRAVLASPKPVYNSGLTSREKDVLDHLVSGASNREIANRLVISECTVKNHIHNMLEKLQIPSRTKLISYALTSDLLQRKHQPR